jgi:chloramphenicol-sensitive protein RarD
VAYIALHRLHIKRLNTDDEYVTSTPDTPNQQSVPAPAQTTPRGTEPSATQRARRSARNGLLAGIGCYAIWGCIPIFFNAIGRAGPVEILAHRVVWSLVFCVIILVLSRRWSRFTATLRNGRALRTLAVATVLILCNWLVYVYAVTSGHVLDASLGYYINPLVTVILAVLVQKERVQPLTWIALGFGAGAVIVLTVGMGTLPWVSLVLAFSFGFYGLLKSRIGSSVDSLTSLSVETLLAAPFALGFLIWLTAIGQSTFGTGGSSPRCRCCSLDTPPNTCPFPHWACCNISGQRSSSSSLSRYSMNQCHRHAGSDSSSCGWPSCWLRLARHGTAAW